PLMLALVPCCLRNTTMNECRLVSLSRGRIAGLAAIAIFSIVLAQLLAQPTSAKAAALDLVLVDAGSVTPTPISQWKGEGFKAVAVVLEEQTGGATYRDLDRRLSESGLDLYWWIEVARNPKLAAAHPRWMAALGMHPDWQKNFPNLPEIKAGEVAKAFPWV